MRDKIRVNARAYAITGVLLGTVLGVAREGHAQKLRVAWPDAGGGLRE